MEGLWVTLSKEKKDQAEVEKEKVDIRYLEDYFKDNYFPFENPFKYNSFHHYYVYFSNLNLCDLLWLLSNKIPLFLFLVVKAAYCWGQLFLVFSEYLTANKIRNKMILLMPLLDAANLKPLVLFIAYLADSSLS